MRLVGRPAAAKLRRVSWTYQISANRQREGFRDTVTENEALSFVEEHGIVLESARGPVLSVADAVLGGSRRGSWWGHPGGKAFFGLTRRIRTNENVLVCRLVDGKVTYVHRRVWPALARLARRFGAARLAAIQEIHTDAGAHRITRTPFRKWVSSDVIAKASTLSEEDAFAQLGPWARTPVRHAS
jgi:hypothetical protein